MIPLHHTLKIYSSYTNELVDMHKMKISVAFILFKLLLSGTLTPNDNVCLKKQIGLCFMLF